MSTASTSGARRLSAVDIASQLSTLEIQALMTHGTHGSLADEQSQSQDRKVKPQSHSDDQLQWRGWLVLPGNHRESAAFHVGLVASMMQRGLLHRVRHICAQGFSSVVAMVLWAKWDELCALRSEADVVAAWVTPMQAILTQPAMYLPAALRAVGVDDELCFTHAVVASTGDTVAARPELHLCVRVDPDSSAVYCYDSSTFQNPSAHFVLLHLLGIQRFYDVGSDTTEESVAAAEEESTLRNRFARGVQVRASTWSWLLELMAADSTGTGADSKRARVCIASTAHPCDEQDLFDEARMRVYHSTRVLWCTIPYHIHRGNPAAVARGLHRSSFEAPLEIPSSMSISNGMLPDVMKSLIRWGEVCVNRKLNLLGNVLDPKEFQGPWTTFTRCLAVRLQALPRSNSWSSQQQSRILSLLDDGDGECRAMERDVQVTRQPQYHQAEWDQRETWRENSANPDHTARELSRQLAFFQETSELTPRWPSQIPTPDTVALEPDTTDSDMESILQDVQHAEYLRNRYYNTISQYVDVNRTRKRRAGSPAPGAPPSLPVLPAHAVAPAPTTVCQTFCTWLKSKPSGASSGAMLPTRPPMLQRPTVPRLRLPLPSQPQPPQQLQQTPSFERRRGTRRRTHSQRRRHRQHPRKSHALVADASAAHRNDDDDDSKVVRASSSVYGIHTDADTDADADADANTDVDELGQVAFDSFYVNIEQDGGPTSQIAQRALHRRADVLATTQVRTPRKPSSGLVDFVKTQQNLRT